MALIIRHQDSGASLGASGDLRHQVNPEPGVSRKDQETHPVQPSYKVSAFRAPGGASSQTLSFVSEDQGAVCDVTTVLGKAWHIVGDGEVKSRYTNKGSEIPNHQLFHCVHYQFSTMKT